MASVIGWTFVCLLLLSKRLAAVSEELQCPVTPVGALHPVQTLLEKFEAGPGCAARESGNKETHVIAVGRGTNSPDNKIVVLLKPLSLPLSPLRAFHLLLSSKLPVSWRLEAERLPPYLPVHVQVSANSSVESDSLRLHIQPVHSLPFRPRALYRWALEHHGNLSSLTHISHGNQVYIRLGEDVTLPAVCQLQSMFLSHNYMTSDLQPQEVHGRTCVVVDAESPKVHVIKLHSAGSGLCGSLQVEVTVSLVPAVVPSVTQTVVLILSSLVPVNWGITAHGVQGHIIIHSSNTVSSPYPPEPDLTLAITLISDLSTIPNLLDWAADNGYSKVTSYTEADLANRFVIHLAGGRADALAVMSPALVRPEEHHLREWLNGGRAGGGQESFTVQCDDGRLSMAVDQHILQSLSVPVSAVTLRDPACQAQSNGSHFLLVFPVISCGTEGVLLGQPKGVLYKNMMLLWRDKPRTMVVLNETEEKSRRPLGIHFSCLAEVPRPPDPASVDDDNDDDDDDNTPQAQLVPWPPDSELSHLPTPRRRAGPALILKLFGTANYEQRRLSPCVITADQRIYAEISAEGPHIDVAEVKSCVVSPLSDPKSSPFWSVISDGCPADPSLSLVQTKHGREAEADDEQEEGKLEAELLEERRSLTPEFNPSDKSQTGGRGRKALAKMEKMKRSDVAEGAVQPLRFSFILQSVYNNSMQFLHCSLRLCVSDSTRARPVREEKNYCTGGPRIPPLVYRMPRHQCEIRNLSRPMVVTQSISSLAPKLLKPLVGQRTKRLSVSQLASRNPEQSSFMAQTGLVMGIVFAAFVMGVSLMGALWCIYTYTGPRPSLLRGGGHLIDQIRGEHNIWSPPSQSDQSTSSV